MNELGHLNTKFEKFLKKRNLKLTRTRLEILKLINDTDSHFNIDELHFQIQKRQNKVSRASLYRNINYFVEAGIIKKSLRCLDKDHYEKISECPNHIHLLCLKCGIIIEEPSDTFQSLLKRISKKHNFQLDDYTIGLKGLCIKCREPRHSKER